MAPEAGCCAIVREIDTCELACEVKLRLSEVYPDDADAVFLRGDVMRRIKLYEMDRLENYDHMCSVLVMSEKDAARKNACSMADLVTAARMGDKFYAEGDFDQMVESARRLAGSAAWAFDRGDYGISDIITAACQDLLDENG